MVTALYVFLISVHLTFPCKRPFNEGRFDQSLLIFIEVLSSQQSLDIFFGQLTTLVYQKNRIVVWISVPQDDEYVVIIANDWIKVFDTDFHAAYITTYQQDDVNDLYNHAIDYARDGLFSYLLVVQSDVFLTNECLLYDLIANDVVVITPLLMTLDDSSNIISNKNQILIDAGVFAVDAVSKFFLLNLQNRSSLFLNLTSKLNGLRYIQADQCYNDLQFYVDNTKVHGYFSPNFLHRGQFIQFLSRIGKSDLLHELNHKNILSNVNQIYIINLEKRSDRKQYMRDKMQEYGFHYEEFIVWPAVDGSLLTPESLSLMGVSVLPGYTDPYSNRKIKFGEIGCFLSHYSVWENIVEKGQHLNMILEDDVHFSSLFSEVLRVALNSIDFNEHDFVYLGRKPLEEDVKVMNDFLVYPGYSYWTIGYLLTQRGARKLLDAHPLANIVPVDEFLPHMFESHPQYDIWKRYFSGSLSALAIHPPIIQPLYYTDDEAYVSDTENSCTVSMNDCENSI